MNILKTLFEWPNGIVVGNLIASVLWVPFTVIHLDRIAKRHHLEHMALLKRHHKEQLAAINDAATVTPTPADHEPDSLADKDRPAANKTS